MNGFYAICSECGAIVGVTDSVLSPFIIGWLRRGYIVIPCRKPIIGNLYVSWCKCREEEDERTKEREWAI